MIPRVMDDDEGAGAEGGCGSWASWASCGSCGGCKGGGGGNGVSGWVMGSGRRKVSGGDCQVISSALLRMWEGDG